jgi:hypothetical protein
MGEFLGETEIQENGMPHSAEEKREMAHSFCRRLVTGQPKKGAIGRKGFVVMPWRKSKGAVAFVRALEEVLVECADNVRADASTSDNEAFNELYGQLLSK